MTISVVEVVLFEPCKHLLKVFTQFSTITVYECMKSSVVKVVLSESCVKFY